MNDISGRSKSRPSFIPVPCSTLTVTSFLMYPMQHGTFGAKIKVLNNLGQVVQFTEW